MKKNLISVFALLVLTCTVFAKDAPNIAVQSVSRMGEKWCADRHDQKQTD